MSYVKLKASGRLLVLIITPLIYITMLKLLLIGLFDSPAAFKLYAFYNLPLWILLMLLTGMEYYRNRVVPRLTPLVMLLRLVIGSFIIGIIGIVICPAAPALLSASALLLLLTNVLLGTGVALVLLVLSDRTRLTSK